MIYFISDYHLGQKSKPTKRNFDNLKQMHEKIITEWNSVIKDDDTVYIVGDFAFNRLSASWFLKSAKGTKILILGNHDKFYFSFYKKYFHRIKQSEYIDYNDIKFIVSHFPIHSACLKENEYCIHGHVHENTIEDPKLINVSCEVLDYRPISLEEVYRRVTND